MSPEVNKKIKIHIGPLTVDKDNHPIFLLSMEKINELKPTEIQGISETLNISTVREAISQEIGCATCNAAKYMDSGPNMEFQFNAYCEIDKGNMPSLVIEAGCPVLTYAAVNGFREDAECNKITKPIPLNVGTIQEKRTIYENIKWFSDFLKRLLST